MSQNITTLDQAKAWFPRVPADEVGLAWGAAEAYVSGRCEWPGSTSEPATPVPAELVQAVRLMTARLLQRSKSPEGVIGMDPDGLGAVRIAKFDVDVRGLMDPWLKAVLA